MNWIENRIFIFVINAKISLNRTVEKTMKKCLFHIEQLCLFEYKGGGHSLLYSFTVFRSDSMCRTLDYNWFYTEWREECVIVMNNFCYMCKAALTGPRKCSPTSLGVFFQNIFEKKKIKTFQKVFHWLKRSLRTEEEDSKQKSMNHVLNCSSLQRHTKQWAHT